MTSVTAPSQDAARPQGPAPAGRRERRRAGTVQEIKDTARRMLVAEGPAALSLRAIARAMGVTAPALYRYFDSHGALVEALVGDVYDELCDAMEAAADRVRLPDAGDPADLPVARLVQATRTFRAWSVAHPAEFGLVFGAPIPGIDLGDDGPACVGGRRFGEVFARLFAQLWSARPFPVPDVADLDPRVVPQVAAYAESLGIGLDVGTVYVFLSCWARLYGMVAMEVFGHLRFAFPDAEPVFEAELAQIGRLIGVNGRH